MEFAKDVCHESDDKVKAIVMEMTVEIWGERTAEYDSDDIIDENRGAVEWLMKKCRVCGHAMTMRLSECYSIEFSCSAWEFHQIAIEIRLRALEWVRNCTFQPSAR